MSGYQPPPAPSSPASSASLAPVLDHDSIISHATPTRSDPEVPAESPGCGGDRLRSLYCASCGHEVTVPVTCASRSCPDCRKRHAARLMAVYAPRIAQVPPHRLALLTVTTRIQPGSGIPSQLRRLRAGWSRLIRRRVWSRVVAGALAVAEAAWSDRHRGWGVHLHAIVETTGAVERWVGAGGKIGADLIGAGGARLSPQALSETWRDLTGDSYIVDIQPIRALGQGRGGAKGALRYVCKYLSGQGAAMGWSESRDYDYALRGRRLAMTCGTWHAGHKQYRWAHEPPRPVRPCPECGSEAGWVSEWQMVQWGRDLARGLSPPWPRAAG